MGVSSLDRVAVLALAAGEMQMVHKCWVGSGVGGKIAALIAAAAIEDVGVQQDQDLWVFGYGSLMWRPGFTFVEQVNARLFGMHRALCVASYVHRGTRERPGLVLGLDRGGSCRGRAFRVAADQAEATIAYLREREQVTQVYIEAWRRLHLERPGAPSVTALTYIVDRHHEQYAGGLALEQQLQMVRHSVGQSGPNPDYVRNTVAAIEDMGFRDRHLHWLAERL